MGNRGRRSAASLSVVSNGNVVAIHRPNPPEDLTSEQSDEWWAIVNRMPADWFLRESHGLLAQYCRHVVAARRVAKLVADCESAPALDLDQYDQLLKMQEREGRALSSLATRMRISQHSSFAHTKTRGQVIEDPWDGG